MIYTRIRAEVFDAQPLNADPLEAQRDVLSKSRALVVETAFLFHLSCLVRYETHVPRYVR